MDQVGESGARYQGSGQGSRMVLRKLRKGLRGQRQGDFEVESRLPVWLLH